MELNKEAALLWAIENERVEIFKALLRTYGVCNWTASFAEEYGYLDIVELIDQYEKEIA